MSIIQNKDHISIFFIIYCFLFVSCKNFRKQFADEITWIPKHEYTLAPESGVAPVLSDKIPLILNIEFDTEWNNKNKPNPLHNWEKFTVNEDSINFLVKDVRVEGGTGKLFYRTETGGKSSVGDPFESGSKVKHGETKLYYVPETKDDCYRHTVSIVSTILTNDFAREAGKQITCSLKLGEPSYDLKANSDCKIAYVEDKGGTPIHVIIASDNELAAQQKYRLVNWYVQGGQGTMYIGVGEDKEPVSHHTPLKFGSNTLFYVPKPGSDGTHTIHIEAGNAKGDTTQKSSFSIKVEDHRIADFTVELSLVSEEEPLLPFKDRSCRLTINPLTDAGKVLKYRIKSINVKRGKFILNNNEVIEGTPLSAGINGLVLRTCGHIGDLSDTIIVVNDKGDERLVTFTTPFVIKHPGFKVKTSMVDRRIKMKIDSFYNNPNDKFFIYNYRLSGGIEGTLQRFTGDPVPRDSIIPIGENAFTFQLGNIDAFIGKIDGPPKLYFDMVYPDGTHHETPPVDLSLFLFEGLAHKLASLSDDSKNLYKPVGLDYSLNPELAFQGLEEVVSNWYNRGSKLRDILVYMQHDTTISDQATRVVTHLQTLKGDTKSRINKRVLTTKLLHNWHKEMGTIHSNQEPGDRKMRTDQLCREVNLFANVFRSCVDIPNMEDVVPALEAVNRKIDELKRETEEKDAQKIRKEKEYEDFKDRTTRDIETERKDRKADVRRLESEIEELCEGRDEIESKIRRHDGDISDLNALMEELSRVNNTLRSKCRILEVELERLGIVNRKLQSELNTIQAKAEREEYESYLAHQEGRVNGLW